MLIFLTGYGFKIADISRSYLEIIVYRGLRMKIKCKLGFDVRKDIGLCDIIDRETGEVLKTAEEVFEQLIREPSDTRPCAKRDRDGKPNRWVEKRRGCILQGGKRRCEHCVEVIYEDGDEELKQKAPAATGAKN